MLVKAKPGMEREILDRFKALLEVREVHLITGKFDLLVTLESEETELDPRGKVTAVVIDKVRKAGGVVDTRTIIPIDSQNTPSASSRETNDERFRLYSERDGQGEGADEQVDGDT